MAPEEGALVIDTSSIIQVRRLSIPFAKKKAVFNALEDLVDQGKLHFPKKVLEELERFSDLPRKGMDKSDLPLEWVRRNEPIATLRPGQVGFDRVRDVLKRVPKVCDPEKSSGVEEADPYVLALALELKAAGHSPTVLTEEISDRPDKMSMNSACGVLKLYSLRVEIFLRDQGILSD